MKTYSRSYECYFNKPTDTSFKYLNSDHGQEELSLCCGCLSFSLKKHSKIHSLFMFPFLHPLQLIIYSVKSEKIS